MQITRFNNYIESMNRIEAMEMLTKLKVMDYPNMKPEGRSRVHRQLVVRAYPESLKERAITPEEMVKLINGGR